MRILFILNYFGIHGSSISLINIASQLKKNNHKIYFIGGDGELKMKFNEIGTSISEYNQNDYLPSFKKLNHIRKLIKKWEINCVIGIGKFNSLEGQLSNILFLKKEPISVLNFSRIYHWSQYPIWSLPDIGYMTVNSDYYKDNTVKRYKWNRKNIAVISARYNIPDKVVIRPIINKEKLKLLFVRRLDYPKYKSVLIVLDQLSKWKIWPKISIQIIGSGQAVDRIKNKIIKLKETFPELEVQLLGKKKNVNEIMISSDIIIGSERVAVEGIIAGKLVLLANDDGLIDIIKPQNIKKFNYDNYYGINYGPNSLLEIENNLLEIIDDKKKFKSVINNNFKFVKKYLKVEKGVGILTSIISKSASSILTNYQVMIYGIRLLKSWVFIYFLLIRSRLFNKK